MKNILFVLLLWLISFGALAQTYIAKATSGADQTLVLQNEFDKAEVSSVIISSPNMLLNGTLTIPEGKLLKFEAGCKLTGSGTINGVIIEANYQLQIFDTTLAINPRAVNQYFSVKWFGAKGDNNFDDYNAIQKSINTCIKNNIRTVFIPAGKYKISQPLILRGIAMHKEAENFRSFCTLEVLGESSFWDMNVGSEIYPTYKNTFAIGIQNGKGCKISKLKIQGLFIPPFSNDRKKFFNSKFEEFTDAACRDSRYSPYAAIVIDPFTNLASDKIPSDGGYPGLTDYYGKANSLATSSGSTAMELEELSIKNFAVGICSSPNALTRNADILIINKIQFENCKLCISGGHDQNKGNVISNIYCWGGTHTIFATGLYGAQRQAGNWNIDKANIAGGVVRFIYNDQHGYFPTYVAHVYAEELGTWGTINSEIATEISDCHIDFAYQREAGVQTLITSWGENVVYRNCNFRYYGEKIPLKIEGNCVFDHCYFSGPLIKSSSSLPNTFFGFKINLKTVLITVALIVFILLSATFYYRKRIKNIHHTML